MRQGDEDGRIVPDDDDEWGEDTGLPAALAVLCVLLVFGVALVIIGTNAGLMWARWGR